MVIRPLIVLISYALADSYTIKLYAGTGQNGRYDDAALTSRFNEPSGIVIDEYGWMMIADSANNVIRGIPISSGAVYTFAGNGNVGTSDGNSQSTSFYTPVDVCYSTYDNFVYVADKNNHLIRGIGLDNKVITKAGTGVAGIKNGVRLSAQFSNPSGLATDQTGIIYVADTGNSVIRKIAIDGTVSTLAGTGSPSFGDGLGTETGFNQPMGLAIDSSGKLLYVADTGNNLIRLINMTDGNARVSTVSGKTGPPPDSLSPDYFKTPSNLDIDSNGNLYVADSGNAVIKKISRSGSVEILTFSESSGFTEFQFPYGIHVASLDTIYVSDQKAHKIYKISINITDPTFATSSTTVSSSTSTTSASSSTSTTSASSSTSTTSASSSKSTTSASSSKSTTSAATTSKPTKTSSSTQASSTSKVSATPLNWRLITSPVSLKSDTSLGSGQVSETFQVSFDIVITGRKADKGYILAMLVRNNEYLGIYLEPSSYRLTVSIGDWRTLARRQSEFYDHSASVDLKANQNQTINIKIGNIRASLYVDAKNIQNFTGYGIPFDNITIQTSPFGSSVAQASISNLVLASSPDVPNVINISVPFGPADNTLLILGCTLGSICFVAILVVAGYRFKFNRYRNISAPEANTDNNDSGADGQSNNQATERGSHRRERSRRRTREQNQQPMEPAPPEYMEYPEEAPPLYLSNINLAD